MTTTEQKLTLAREALEAISHHIPTTSAKDGGAAKYSAHVAAADKVREALAAIATESAPAAGTASDDQRSRIRAILLANGFTIKPGHDDLKPYVYAAAQALIDDALAQRAAGSTPVIFMGVDPLAIGAGAVKPMIPDSWRFGFYQINGELRFGFSDNGPLVAWDAVEPMLAARAVGGVVTAKSMEWPDELKEAMSQFRKASFERDLDAIRPAQFELIKQIDAYREARAPMSAAHTTEAAPVVSAQAPVVAAPAQAVDALGIKTWQERAPGLLQGDIRVDAAMRAEIAELRAALAAQPAAPDTDIFDLIREWAHLPEGKRGHVARKIIGCLNRSYSAGVADGRAIGELSAKASPVANAGQAREPERLNIEQSREYLVKFMRQHFTDKTFQRYIFANRPTGGLAGDFAWQLARAIRIISAAGQAQAVAVPDGTRENMALVVTRLEQIIATEGEFSADLVDMAKEALPCAEAVAQALAAPLPQQVAPARLGRQWFVSDEAHAAYLKNSDVAPTSRDAYDSMTPERKSALDTELKGLEQRIESHRRSRDRRTHDEPVAEERRHGDRRHAERRDAED